ncbi:hypothetical protein [Acidovorax sp. ACV01]|uniref:hypothetical protein n=1 Tax=Acidovorax sp. ACV01 TaxID=2769311 RepID=UPI00177EE0B4|nr:hypothetical protein [Acidovorax sp. ACV01]MBD9395756.1 hypothetical protein [Acidovorax sp. ACV01]
MTRTEHQSQVTALAHRLVEIVSEQQTHRVALEALISAYASVAVCHPCCAQGAATTARQVADLIQQNAAAPANACAAHLN